MDEFIEKFEKFRDFLNSKSTEHNYYMLFGKDAEAVLKDIRNKFDELGLNNVF